METTIIRTQTRMNRRDFVQLLTVGGVGCLSLYALPGLAEAVRGTSLPWARLKFPCRGGDMDDWSVHPNGDLNLIDEIRSKTSLNVEKRWNVAESARLETLTPYPFIFMHAEMAPALGPADVANLREYLLRGGFLFAEDCVNGKGRSDRSGDEFFRRMRDVEFPRILPEASLEKLPDDHPVFHCFYQFKNGLPMMPKRKPHGLHGLKLNGRVVALLSATDLHCGWTNGAHWFGAKAHQESLQMGINIYVFALIEGGVVNAASLGAPPSGDRVR
jgi:hypothetical protein